MSKLLFIETKLMICTNRQFYVLVQVMCNKILTRFELILYETGGTHVLCLIIERNIVCPKISREIFDGCNCLFEVFSMLLI